MSKSILGLLLTLLCAHSLRAEQPNFTIGSASGNPGETVSINFTVDDFTDIVSAQFSIQWDPEVLAFEAVTNLNTSVNGLNLSSFNLMSFLPEGQITFLWLEPSITPVTIPDGSILFTLEFEVIGEPCESSNIAITDVPSEIEVSEPNEVLVGLTSNVGQVSVPGTGCSENIQFIGESVIGPCGGESCVAFTVENFTNVAVMEFSMNYDPSVLEFVRFQNLGPLPVFSEGGNTFSPSPGVLRVVWINGNVENSSLEDGTTIFEICFNVIGTGGQSSTITFSETPPVEFTDVDLNQHEVGIQPAMITAQCSLEGFALIAEEDCTMPGELVCIDISVNDFEDIIAAQFSINWDSTKFKFDHVEGFNLVDLEEGSFGTPGNPGVTEGQLSVLWLDFSTEGVTIPDMTRIFTLCLRAVGAAGTSSIISFTSIPTEIEIATEDSVLVFTLVNGRAEIKENCDNPPCELSYTIDVTNPDCPGEASGSINLSVNTGGCGTPTYLWSNDFTTEDISGLPAGTYTVTITLGQQIVVATDMVVDPPSIGVTSTITNPVPPGSSTGGINISVTGGTPGYTYQWNTDPVVTTEDLTNIPAGTYMVTITDSRGCVFIPDPFIVGADIAGSVTDATCFGECDGSITASPSFGTPVYTYLWNTNPVQNTATISNLCAGTYCVTITDGGGLTRDTCFTVAQPSTEMVLSATVTHDENENGQGAIDLNVVGGTNPYSYVWSTGDMSQDLINLSQGQYCVTVTDGNGCTATMCFDVFAGGVNVSLTAKQYGNFQTSCGSTCDGEITSEVTGGVAPFTYKWSNNAITPDLTNLCAGIYSVTVTDATGNSTVASRTIASPAVLSFTSITTLPSDVTTADGAISIVVTGGEGPITYNWEGPVTGNTASMTNLPFGTYTITVTDANGCEFTDHIELKPPGVPCYQASTIITPNDDGKNDFFILTCIFDNDNRLFIYNRSGGQVFETTNYDNSWTGVDGDNQLLPDGGYFWVLEVTRNDGSQQILRGTVNILRTAD